MHSRDDGDEIAYKCMRAAKTGEKATAKGRNNEKITSIVLSYSNSSRIFSFLPCVDRRLLLISLTDEYDLARGVGNFGRFPIFIIKKERFMDNYTKIARFTTYNSGMLAFGMFIFSDDTGVGGAGARFEFFSREL
ncbi:hypothetical protein L2E82_31388 [Cichorium intybus]|uniref:Uncharacterized protein n=1 Tax=Cichorium intybus TaxID=13427 RepID=A0ACB9D3D6_CICIN|nr:hypothetical protein L2E82_31388 [Cichorium intybus]